MRNSSRRLPIRQLLLVLLLAPVLQAATYLVPTDAEMIQASDAIVIATGVSSFSERDARGGIVTRVTLRVEEVLKGDPGSHLVLTESGGVLRDRVKIIAGTPRYEPGVRYLVFTSTNRDLEPTTFSMSLGQFELAGDVAVRREIHGFTQNLEAHEERPRVASRFIEYIRDVVAHRFAELPLPATAAAAPPAVKTEALEYLRSSYLLEDGGVGYRWQVPTVNWVRAGTQPGSDGALAVTRAFAQWNGTESNIDYRDRGVDETATTGLNPDDGRNAILFNDPENEIPDGSGVIGVGGASGIDKYGFEGETFHAIVEGDVVIANRSFSQACLDTLLVHELGHTLGIRHSFEPPPGFVCDSTAECTTAAIMNASISCGFNGVLRDWDLHAAATVYGNGPTCTPVAITIHPSSREIRRGGVVSLSVAATGTGPLRYAWYEGDRGNTSKPVGHNLPVFNLTTPLYQSTKYWVRVSNDCGEVDSATAVITVPPGSKRRGVRH